MAIPFGATDTALTRRPCALRALCVALLATVLGAGQTGALAQAYPSRPVRLIVPFSPGAAVDVVARMIASGLSAQWGNPVIVDNRPGGNSVIGSEMVVRAEPDGYTLLFTSDDIFVIVPHLSKLSFDPLKDLMPVNLLAKTSMLIVVNAAAPVDSLAALIARARANPKALSYSSSGSGSSTQLAMETLKSLAKIDILHVPYKGIAPAIAAAAAGEVQITMTGYGTARGLIDAGRLRPIAIAANERVVELPNVPTTNELGYGEVQYTVWLGIAAPSKTPAEIVERINESVSRVLHSPETRKQLVEARAFVVADLGPRAFAEELARKSRFHAEAIRRTGTRTS